MESSQAFMALKLLIYKRISTYARYFEFKDKESSNFWEINVTGKKLTIRYGKNIDPKKSLILNCQYTSRVGITIAKLTIAKCLIDNPILDQNELAKICKKHKITIVKH